MAVGIPLDENPQALQVYVVTARHVIEGMLNLVLRLNKYGGGFDTIQTNRRRWIDHPDGDDLSALPIDFDPEVHDFLPIMIKDFVDEGRRRKILLPGDEVFMIGRFFSQEGTIQNTPSVRFGNISMLPLEPMKNKWDVDQESYLVEQRSLPGYSGAAVFALIDPAKPRPPQWLTLVNPVWSQERYGPWLLGIDWCHIHNYERVLENDKKTPATPKQWVRSHTGMAGVIPAWRVITLLNNEEFVMQRKKEDADITSQKKASHITFDSVSEGESTPEEVDFTQADFDAALRKVSRKIQPEK